MLPAYAGIHRSSKQSLVLYINNTNATSIDYQKVFFSAPVPVADTWRAGTTEKNTIIRITAEEDYETFRGSALVVYDRLDLSNLNDLIELNIETYQPATTHDFLMPIFYRFGIILEPADIIDEPLVNLEENELNPAQYKLRAHTDSLGWIGECIVTHIEGRVEFRELLAEQVLPGFNYPTEGDGTQGSAIVYMYGLDFTDVKDVLELYPEEMVLDETATDLLEAIVTTDINAGKGLWNLDPARTDWSLYGAEVFYNGINDASLPTNKSYKYVMGIRLRDDIVTPPGVMYLHYNDPFDPMALEQA